MQPTKNFVINVKTIKSLKISTSETIGIGKKFRLFETKQKVGETSTEVWLKQQQELHQSKGDGHEKWQKLEENSHDFNRYLFRV